MEQINITTPEKKPGVQKIDIEQEEKKFTLSLKETDRLLFAKQVLFFIFLFSVIIVGLAVFSPTNELIIQMVDLVKIGVLPLVTLIVSFYFPQSIKDKNSN
ncbi:hypothetical protein VCE00_004631 [Salmonella enterica]|nr:hypothetical protein [Salmonella enterica]